MGKKNKNRPKRKSAEQKASPTATATPAAKKIRPNPVSIVAASAHKSSFKKTAPKKPPALKESSLSLASQLKRKRGTAESTPLPPEWAGSTKKSFLTPADGADFTSCLQQCYRGFHWENPEALPNSLHTSFDTTFAALRELFLYDAVQPGGKRVSQTFVKRTLIGKPGSTYRYLGLRLFSHPWCPVDNEGDPKLDTDDDDNNNNDGAIASLVALGYRLKCASALIGMGQLNATLVQRTQRLLQEQVAPHVQDGLVGPSDYTLTLVNRMEPTNVKRDLKKETTYGMGKTSVSWHKDSGLMDFSSIAVYHTLTKITDDDRDDEDRPSDAWRVALRVASSIKDTKTPPLAVSLPTGAIYYLLDDFNHNHEHAVLAGGNQLRYSSTHRVAREGRGTWQYIRDKCRGVLASDKPTNKQELVKVSRAQQQLLTEIEFEWLRQWYIQGSLHSSLHVYWHNPMKSLEQYYQELVVLASETLTDLQRASEGDHASLASEPLFDVFIETFEDRAKARHAWEERLADPIFDIMPQNARPIQETVFCGSKGGHELLADVKRGVQELRGWRKVFVVKTQTTELKGVASNGRADLTKKEKRKVASNWEQMKTAIAKTKKKSKTK
jgi:mRNA N6-methyladenine demethylase